MNGAAPPLILRRRDGRRVVVRLRLRLGAILGDIRHTWYWDDGRENTVFIYYVLVHGLDPVRVLGHGPVLDVGVEVDLGWTFGWTCGVPKVDLPHLRRPW